MDGAGFHQAGGVAEMEEAERALGEHKENNRQRNANGEPRQPDAQARRRSSIAREISQGLGTLMCLGFGLSEGGTAGKASEFWLSLSIASRYWQSSFTDQTS